MELKFIGQGLDSENDVATGNHIITALEDDRYTSFCAFVAFVSKSGINNILEELTVFIDKGNTVKLYVGVDLNSTSKEALEKLIELGIETYIVFSPNNIIYHPKIYAFEGAEYSKAIIGSSNFTARGLFQSIEASVSVSFNNEEDEEGTQFLNEVYEYYNTILDNSNPSCQLLTADLLDVLVNSKIVLTEKAARSKHNKINKEFSKRDLSAYEELLDKFKKLKLKKPPKGHKKVVEAIVKTSNKAKTKVKVTNQLIKLPKGGMWIQTGLMTSPARNILGLSKKGKLTDKSLVNGSVAFFGINPDVDVNAVQIEVEYAGDIYKGNQVHYTPKNGSWRLNFYGETDKHKKFNDITRPTLGLPGAFQNKILLFTQVNINSYKLKVLDESELDKLKDNSSLWAKNGSSPYLFGIIK